jgi:glycosyltransferase involved in cell wall biosynthesis
MNSGGPIVSVVMAIHNGNMEEVQASTFSIINQSYCDIEFIIVDDGNEFSISNFLYSLSLEYNNVIIIKNNSNIGLTLSLIKAIGMASGKYIARQDADDVSHIERIAEQVRFLEKHTHVVLLGTEATVINHITRASQSSYMNAGSHNKILALMFEFNPFCHSSVMFRLKAYRFAGGYNAKFHTSQDFDLWFRLLDYGEISILAKNLVTRNITNSSLSTNFRKAFQQIKNGFYIRVRERRRINQKYILVKIFMIFIRSIIILLIPDAVICFLKRILFKTNNKKVK